jgi:hypothetical protein
MNVCGHKEWTTRKIDPHSINMNGFRQAVAAQTKEGLDMGAVQDIIESNVKQRKMVQETIINQADRVIKEEKDGRKLQTKNLRRAVWAAQGKTSEEIADLEARLPLD